MPLVRVGVRSEYALGESELYGAASTREDPKAVLDGVAVAGLVGILRQLGDLAEFAADVFRDLHEQVVTTAARGQKMLTRIQRIESALPPLERAVQGQRNHIHFAYLSGIDWHTNVRTEQSQLLCSDLPQFMMDSYDECHDPPRLYLLDKYDSAGAGACLKRYTDPSYFKRALTSSGPVKAEKVQRKKKKKGWPPRNGEVKNAVPIPRHSSSTQFASPTTDDLSFSSENISLSDTNSKQGKANEPAFFNSKVSFDYIEQISDTTAAVPDELEHHHELSDSVSKMNYNATYDSISHDQPNGYSAYDDSQHESLQQRSAPSSSYVTWDEKNEIVKPTSPKFPDDTPVDKVQDSDSLPVTSEPSNVDYDTAKFANSDQEDILYDLTKVPASCSGGNQFDEVNSETENYVDAANSLESEREVDSECQTKQKMNLLSNANNTNMDSISGKIEEISGPNFDTSDTQTSGSSYSSSDDCASLRFSSPERPESSDRVQPTNSTDSVPKSDSLTANNPNETHISNSRMNATEDLNSDPTPELSISDVQPELINGTKAETSESQHFPCTSNMPFVNIWTNGGILGVEPSKPPDFSISNVAANSNLHHDGSTASTGSVIMGNDRLSKDSCFVEKRNISYDGIPVKQNIQDSTVAPPLCDIEKSQEASFIKTSAHINGLGWYENKVAAPGADLSVTSNVELQSNESDQNTVHISASFAGLAQRLLANSHQRKVFVNHGDVSTPPQLVNNDGTRSQDATVQNKPNIVESNTSCKPETIGKIEFGSVEKTVNSSPFNSGSSSPPLEHMKISFHPLNSWEASKLKLEFSSGNHENTEDLMFPSFQLIPGASVTLLDSESDDDTFCRSYPYSSEDLLSPRSESNSELWGEDERSGSQKHEASDDSCRKSSSATSIASLVEFEQMNLCSIEKSGAKNGTISFLPNPNLDGPGVDSMKFSKIQQREICQSLSTGTIDSTCQMPNELPPPPPPPLPPLQWRMAKPSTTAPEDKYPTNANIGGHMDGLQIQISSGHELQEKDLLRSCNAETAFHATGKSHYQLKKNGHRECQSANIKESDEREEFLHRIRNKSFNLRHTATSKPGSSPAPTTNASVAAILEKANVIHQAFAGNNGGGDDDSWSEG